MFLVRKISEGEKGELFAMKVLKKATVVKKRKVMEHTLTERSVLEAIRDFPFLVTLHFAFQTETKLHLIMGKEWSRQRRYGDNVHMHVLINPKGAPWSVLSSIWHVHCGST